MSEDIDIRIVAEEGGAAKVLRGTAQQVEHLDGRVQEAARRMTVFSDRMARIGRRMSVVSAGVVGASGALFALANSAANTGNRIDKQSKAIGLSAETFQELGFAIGQVSDMSEGQFANAIRQMNTRMGQAGEGSASMIAAFEKIGITQEDIRSGTVDTEEAFNALVEALQNSKTPAEAAAMAGALLGEEAARLGPILMEAGGDMDDLRQKARDLGIVMSNEGVQASAEFTDKMDELSRQFRAVKDQIGVALIPVLTGTLLPAIQDKIIPGLQKFADNVQGIVTWFQDLPGPVIEAGSVVAGVLGVGGPILVAVAAASKAFAALVAATGPIGLLITAAGLLTAAWIKWGDDITAAIGTAIDFMTERFNQFLAFIQSLPERFMEIGRAIIDGLKEGINEKWEELKERIYEMANILPNWMRDGLESNSPSRVFMRIGNDIGAGLAQGISQSTGMVMGALTRVTGQAAAQTQGSVGTILGAMQTLFQGSKTLGIAQALINTWQGATEALKLPFPANIAAFAQTLATGMGAVQAIRSTSPGGGAGIAPVSAVAPSAPAPVVAAPAPSQQQVRVVVGDGQFFSRDVLLGLVEEIADLSRDGAIVTTG